MPNHKIKTSGVYATKTVFFLIDSLTNKTNDKLKKNLFASFFFVFLFFNIVFSYAENEIEISEENLLQYDEYFEEQLEKITNEAPSELLKFSLWDSNVSLFLTGSWKATLQGNFGFSVSPLGVNPTSQQTTPFSQDVDLMLSLWVNKKLFVETTFLDESNKNTFRAGYKGSPGEFIQYIGIGNTGLDFPEFPYLDLTGDSTSSPGFYGHFKSWVNKNNSKHPWIGSFDFHTLFRYDAALREEKIFYGGRERTYSYVQPQNTLNGISFVLPDTNIDSDITVYLEDEKGNLRDSTGRRWREALHSEYAAGRVQGLLEINAEYNGMAAVSYAKGGARPWNDSMGSYSGITGEYLNDVQNWFGPRIKLENLKQCGSFGNSSRPGEVVINGNYALVIREPGTFSPFEKLNIYHSPSISSEEANVVELSSGMVINKYELVLLERQTNMTNDDSWFFDNNDNDDDSFPINVNQRTFYELLLSSGNFSKRGPETCWPLADIYPEFYFPSAGTFSGDIGLRFTNYSGTGAYYIGSDIVSGSIHVYRDGFEDSNFTFDSNSGEVFLQSQSGRNELIRITFLKSSEEIKNGSFAAGLGVVYNSEKSPFLAQAALGVRWNLDANNSFTEGENSSQGTAGISLKTAWDYDFFKAGITAGFFVGQIDTTGLFRAAGMEGNETVIPLPPDNSFISNPAVTSHTFALDSSNRADLIHRNYYNNTFIGSNLMNIDWNSSKIISGVNKPYPVKVKEEKYETQPLIAEFTINSEKNWTGFQVPINNFSEILRSASEIEIRYKFYDFNINPVSGFYLIIQIGSLSGEDYIYTENPDLIWEKDIFDSGSNEFDTNLKIARFKITEDERIRLMDAKSLRLLVVYDGINDEISGRVFLFPPVVHGSMFNPVVYDNNSGILNAANDFSAIKKNHVTAVETIEVEPNSLESAYSAIIKRLHPTQNNQKDTTQRVLKIEWENMENGMSAGIDGRIAHFPLSDYHSLSFYVKGASISSGTLKFIAASGPHSLDESWFEACIPLSAFKEGQWSKVTVRYQGKNIGIEVDNGDASGAWFRYTKNKNSLNYGDVRSDYIAILINPEDNQSLPDSSIFIDEIILEDTGIVNRMNVGAYIEYSKPGIILSLGKTAAISDFKVSTTVESELRSDLSGYDKDSSFGINNRTNLSIDIFGFKTEGNFIFIANNDSFIWSQGHKLSKKNDSFSLGGDFYASPDDNFSQRNINAGFSSIFYANLNADVIDDKSKLDQKWEFNMGLNTKNKYIPAVEIKTNASYRSNNKTNIKKNYGELWLSTWRQIIPDFGSSADVRNTQGQINITERTKPVGAILLIDTKTAFTKANEIINSQSAVSLDIPVSFNNLTFNFITGRTLKRQLLYSSKDVIDDGKIFFQNINNTMPLWANFPVYSLFALKMNKDMDKTIKTHPELDNLLYTSFIDYFQTKMNIPSFINLTSLFVPSSINFKIERNLEQKLDTRSDLLGIHAGLVFSSINMFGNMGYLPLFKFYRNDEFYHNIEMAFIIPKDENFSWKIQSAAGANFYGFTGGELNFLNTITINSKNYLLESVLAGWSYPAKNTLMSFFYDWLASLSVKNSITPGITKLLNSKYESLRKESLEFTFEKIDGYYRMNILPGHEAIVRIQGKLNFSGFAKLRINEDFKNSIFSCDILIGTAFSIIF